MERSYNPSAAAVTPVRVASWMAWLATRGRLKASTIDAYSSAVSTWHKFGTMSDVIDIGTSTAVAIVRAGIHKSLKPAENAARERAADLTPAVLSQIVASAPGTGSRAVMLIAAASVGVYGCLRANELLGSHQHRDRALSLSSVSFWADASGLRRVFPGKDTRAVGPIPHHFSSHLGVTKADQEGANKDHEVAARPAVEALWNWLHLRTELRAPGSNDRIFIEPHNGWKLLSMAELCRQLSAWAKAAGITPCDFKGKSFRRGGARGMMEAGAQGPDIMRAGRWSSDRMPALYAGPEAMRIRQLQISKAMAPAPRRAGL